jgi:protein-tyrosine phosphatase
VHCLAGAHRAGTTGVAYLMYRNRIGQRDATRAAQLARPIINPIGLLAQLLVEYEVALKALSGAAASTASSGRERQASR